MDKLNNVKPFPIRLQPIYPLSDAGSHQICELVLNCGQLLAKHYTGTKRES
uniref:Uncharacterized protein n=1 Tax=Anguilla anguilla TaxID=7936 RepID=A0A0E9XGU6_ANGAN